MNAITVLVDADACPVVKSVERIAKKHNVPVVLLCDTNHVLKSDYSEIKIIGAGADAVDLALVNLCKRGDIAVTQDYGVAALVLGKGAYCIHQSGKIFSDDSLWTDTLPKRRECQTASITLKDRKSVQNKMTKTLKKALNLCL